MIGPTTKMENGIPHPPSNLEVQLSPQAPWPPKPPISLHQLALGFLLASRFPNQVDV